MISKTMTLYNDVRSPMIFEAWPDEKMIVLSSEKVGKITVKMSGLETHLLERVVNTKLLGLMIKYATIAKAMMNVIELDKILDVVEILGVYDQ